MTEQVLPLTVTLPERLAEVFRSLRTGRHICRDDVADYRDLEHNEDLYQVLLGGLGYITSHAPRAKPLGRAIRNHWGIENAQHWSLDVTFGDARTRQTSMRPS